MAGVKIRHSSNKSCLHTIPVLSKPRDGWERFTDADRCPSCNVIHPVKTYHLWLDDTGSAIVSTTVLEGLKQAGMPGLSVVEEVKNPPPLTISPGLTRAQVDKNNRRVWIMRKKWK